MIYVAGQVFGNFVFAMSLRWARNPRFHYLTVGTINYAVAAVLAVIWLVINENTDIDLLVVFLGVVNGLQYQISLAVLFSVVQLVGIGITFGIIRLSIAMPTLASIYLWGEQPSTLQVVGLVLAFFALPLLGADAHQAARKQSGHSLRTWGVLIIVLLLSGAGFMAAKAFSVWSTPDYQPLYTASVFVAATLSAAFIWPLHRRFRLPAGHTASLRDNVSLGVVMGAANLFQIAMLLGALEVLPGTVVFPLTATVGLATTLVGGIVLFGERFGRITAVGIVLALVAIVLINGQ
jgi:multidrug transporter EmrE-like cation transporter